MDDLDRELDRMEGRRPEPQADSAGGGEQTEESNERLALEIKDAVEKGIKDDTPVEAPKNMTPEQIQSGIQQFYDSYKK
jgi:hypothetical protein